MVRLKELGFTRMPTEPAMKVSGWKIIKTGKVLRPGPMARTTQANTETAKRTESVSLTGQMEVITSESL
jgi:hypothetical protein